ncbi:hypothetical protein G3I15_47335, partial [Streptomyces sp. SID10244]|nr:hypothetical protein [Streptomyces sp. SID10244]
MTVGGQHHREPRDHSGVVGDGLDLVPGGPLERSEEIDARHDVEEAVHTIDVASTGSLID